MFPFDDVIVYHKFGWLTASRQDSISPTETISFDTLIPDDAYIFLQPESPLVQIIISHQFDVNVLNWPMPLCSQLGRKEHLDKHKILQWRHNGHDSVSNHQPHGCLLNRLFRRKSKKTSLRHWPLCGEFTGTGEFPAQRASYAENVSIWWLHHGSIFSLDRINHDYTILRLAARRTSLSILNICGTFAEYLTADFEFEFQMKEETLI